MRCPLVSIFLVSVAVVSAHAQPGKPGPGGGHAGPAPAPAAPPAAAAPHPAPAAPAPHMAAPAPAPHMAAPAPPPAAAPHVAAPRAAPPHVAAPVPHAPPPHVAAPARPATPRASTPRAAERAAPSQRLSAQPPNVQRSPPAQAAAPRGPAARGGPAPAPQITQGPIENRNAAPQPGPSGQNAQARPGPGQQQLGASLPPSRSLAPGIIASPEPRNPAQAPAQVTSRVSPQAAAQERFAAPFVSQTLQQRAVALPAWDAWRQRRRAAFVAWAGPVFWPYVYADMFYYAFWPTAYDDGYWAFAYDNLLDGAFWAYGDPYSAFAYAGPNPDTAGLAGGTARSRARGAGAQTAGPQIAAACAQNASIADWPFDQIQSAIGLDPDQRALLQQLQAAAQQAAGVIKQSCPSTFPLTPPGRLQAMMTRLDATISAIDVIRPALVAFYNSLNDEQKARFNAIGPNLGGPQETQTAGLSATNSCGGAKPGLIDLPIDQIEARVHPTNAQQRSLDQLRQASGNAVNALSSACPNGIPGTPIGRLDVMRDRFAAMLQAAQMLQPALSNFYASLNNEQKAAFNTLGQTKQSRG
ncbi:MAG: Spy/CpxP family protein refolding chaperone [Xanthobacteraceae bacterium]|nr:Spy/CpxP family protein refolding chaperone [Xanthobacteraceae bacterium]